MSQQRIKKLLTFLLLCLIWTFILIVKKKIFLQTVEVKGDIYRENTVKRKFSFKYITLNNFFLQ